VANKLRYPRYDLESSLEVAEKIAVRGAGARVTTHELAALLGYSQANNGSFLMRLAAARLFGLIEGQASVITATTRACEIISPDYPATAEQRRIEAFKSVPLFAAFLEAYQGRTLPDKEGMLNTLVTRFGVPLPESKMALSRLLKSADQSGLFRVAGPTRLIEPSSASEPSDSMTDDTGGQGSATLVAPSAPAQTLEPATSRRFPRLIDATLELMPAGPPWDKDEYEQWLAFFDQACRVYYRIQATGDKQTK
jgi:hypothetical protein